MERKTTSTGACKYGQTISSETGNCICRTRDIPRSAKTKAKIRNKCG